MATSFSIADPTNAQFVASLEANLGVIRHALRIPKNRDVVIRNFMTGELPAALVFIEGLTSRDVLERHVLEPCLRLHEIDCPPSEIIDFLSKQVISIYDTQSVTDVDKAIEGLMSGKGLLLCDGCADGLLLEARGFARRGVDKPINESVVLGPQEGFVENLRTNLSLVRVCVHSPRLVTEMIPLGQGIPTQCAVMYLDGIAEESTVQEVLRRIQLVAMDYVPVAGQLEQLIEDHPLALFPQICSTERPDRASSFLLEGQVLVFVDGSPVAMAMPITVSHLLHTSDDTYMRWQFGTFLRLLRTCSMYASLLIPGLYLALIKHHTQAVPTVLLASIYEAQARMPMPLVLEALLMLLAFHLINEAGTRVPGSMGSSLGVLSALILGQAAVSADLVSPLMIIVIAIAGLGTFAIPDYSLSLAVKLRQILYLLVADVAGVYGMLLLYLYLGARLTTMTSFGVPFLAPRSPFRAHNLDLFARFPLWMQRRRSFFANASQSQRTQGPVRRWQRGGPR